MSCRKSETQNPQEEQFQLTTSWARMHGDNTPTACIRIGADKH